MSNFQDTLEEFFIEQLNYNYDGLALPTPDINGKENILNYTKEFEGLGIDIILVECKDRIIEFQKKPQDLGKFSSFIDKRMQEQNVYYFDLIKGSVLQPLKITTIQRDGFLNFMKNRGKLGGQNKIPRLSNDRKIADELNGFIPS